MLKKFFTTSFILGFLWLLPSLATAQINIDPGISLPDELSVELIPNYPQPNERVFISLALYTDNLNAAEITWYKDGKVVLSGRGETRYSFKLGKAGEETVIEVRIKLLSGTYFNKRIALNPAGLDLIWEANSYVPPFYQGKALQARQGSVKVIAMPNFVKNGKQVPAQNLIYEWGNGVESYQSQSGYGKNVLILNSSILGRSEEVEVLITDPINGIATDGFLTLQPVDPEILFYENSPYYGHLLERAVGSIELKSAEAQILAAPYYFSREDLGRLEYNWRLNGQSIPNLSGSRTAIFKKPEGERGSSNILLDIVNNNRILQQADANLMMNFEK